MNLIIIILDTLRKDFVGCYGNNWIKTPNLDELAKESVVFTQAYPETMPTIPFRRALHTGKRAFPYKDYAPKKGDWIRFPGWDPIPENYDTLSEILLGHGYRTAFITDTYHLFKPSMNYHRGFAEWHWIRGQEMDGYRKPLPPDTDLSRYVPVPSRKRLLLQYLANVKDRRCEEDYFAPKVFRAAMKWLEENKDSKRFFLCVDSFDPHEPWDPPKWYVDLYYPNYEGREAILDHYGKTDYLSNSELKHMRACYAGEVTMVDRWLGLFLDKVRQLGLMENTVIVVISDHGHLLGEHGLTGKLHWALYPELVDILLMIYHPEGLGAGEKIDSFVYNVDVFPTVLNLLNIDFRRKVDGVNIWPLVTGEGSIPEREYVTVAWGNCVLVRDKRYASIVRLDGKEPAKLFDLDKDPNMDNDIADSNQDIVKEMLKRIEADASGFSDLTKVFSQKFSY